jgi:hypothetical protein
MRRRSTKQYGWDDGRLSSPLCYKKQEVKQHASCGLPPLLLRARKVCAPSGRTPLSPGGPVKFVQWWWIRMQCLKQLSSGLCRGRNPRRPALLRTRRRLARLQTRLPGPRRGRQTLPGRQSPRGPRRGRHPVLRSHPVLRTRLPGAAPFRLPVRLRGLRPQVRPWAWAGSAPAAAASWDRCRTCHLRCMKSPQRLSPS